MTCHVPPSPHHTHLNSPLLPLVPNLLFWAAGTILGTLEATDVDGDSLNFTTVGEVTNSLVSLSEPRDVPGSPNAKVVDIVLKTELDRDFVSNSSCRGGMESFVRGGKE